MFRFTMLNANGARIVRLPRWAVVLSLVAAAALGLLVLLVAASVALIAVPLVFAAGGIMHWFSRRNGVDIRRSTVFRDEDPQVIDAEYRVIEPSKRP